ncbi:MAG: GIY-YIG nuclease family protein [Methylocystaceae bacterium]|nr:GIY-YIG nuclease family protein [Methylocystaceae bacterium]
MSVSLVGGVRHPKIYAYTIDQYKKSAWRGGRKGSGLIKVGETQRDVAVRIREQLEAVKMPISTPYELYLAEPAITKDGRVFTDKEVHRALQRAGVTNVDGEWFECTAEEEHALNFLCVQNKKQRLRKRQSIFVRTRKTRLAKRMERPECEPPPAITNCVSP